jgi:hypothetical protein
MRYTGRVSIMICVDQGVSIFQICHDIMKNCLKSIALSSLNFSAASYISALGEAHCAHSLKFQSSPSLRI